MSVPWKTTLSDGELMSLLEEVVDDVRTEIQSGTSKITTSVTFRGVVVDKGVSVSGQAFLPMGLPGPNADDAIETIFKSMANKVVDEGVLPELVVFLTEGVMREYESDTQIGKDHEGVIFTAMHADGKILSAVMMLSRIGAGTDDDDYVIDAVEFIDATDSFGRGGGYLKFFFEGASKRYTARYGHKEPTGGVGDHDAPTSKTFYQLIAERHGDNYN